MGTRSGRSGTRSAHLDQKEETIILWLSDEARRRLSGEGACRVLFREQESNGDQRCDGLTTWKNGLRCHLKNYRGREKTDGDGVDLSMKRQTHRTRMVKDKINNKQRIFMKMFICNYLHA